MRNDQVVEKMIGIIEKLQGYDVPDGNALKHCEVGFSLVPIVCTDRSVVIGACA